MVWPPPQPPPEARRDGVKGDADGCGDHLLQLAGDDGGDYQAVINFVNRWRTGKQRFEQLSDRH